MSSGKFYSSVRCTNGKATAQDILVRMIVTRLPEQNYTRDVKEWRYTNRTPDTYLICQAEKIYDVTDVQKIV